MNSAAARGWRVGHWVLRSATHRASAQTSVMAVISESSARSTQMVRRPKDNGDS